MPRAIVGTRSAKTNQRKREREKKIEPNARERKMQNGTARTHFHPDRIALNFFAFSRALVSVPMEKQNDDGNR